jgi:uncharacterized SAM-dependent methyltransferase
MTETVSTRSSLLDIVLHDHVLATFEETVKEGLLGKPNLRSPPVPFYEKTLSCHFFYDAVGSQLFEQITGKRKL